MRIARLIAPALLFTTAVACSSVPDDPGARLFAPAGVIRGTVLYQGPHPCSRNGHIVGNAILLVFDRRNPPPPAGLANTAVNFNDVTGDVLFANEPRYTGSETYCPADHGFTDTITVSAPFVISPLAGGSYMIEAFFDYTGDFLPTFKFRNLPERGDIAGGYLDTADAQKAINVGNPNFTPKFLPVDIGTPQPLPDLGKNPPPNPIPNYTVPTNGFVADNVTVSIGLALPLSRPYFYPQGESVSIDTSTGSLKPTVFGDKSDTPATKPMPGSQENNGPDPADYEPILTIPQDLQVHASPTSMTPKASGLVISANANYFESFFPHLRLIAGLPDGDHPDGLVTKVNEQAFAIDPLDPFHFQLPPKGATIFVWQDSALDPQTGEYVAQQIPEGQSVPYLWPLVVLNKLEDDPTHTADPASLTAQGDPTHPVIIMQGITLAGDPGHQANGQDSLFETAAPALGLGPSYYQPGPNGSPDPLHPIISAQDHLTVLLRPSVICFDQLFNPNNPDKRGTLVVPNLTANSADLGAEVPNQNVVPADLLTNTANDRVHVNDLVKPTPDGKPAVQGCLPTGRYAINVVYPDGQAWSVPNEAGSCSGGEGATTYSEEATLPKCEKPTDSQCTLTCNIKPRPVLYSQGNRAVVEIVPAQTPQGQAYCQAHPVPPQCLPVVQ